MQLTPEQLHSYIAQLPQFINLTSSFFLLYDLTPTSLTAHNWPPKSAGWELFRLSPICQIQMTTNQFYLLITPEFISLVSALAQALFFWFLDFQKGFLTYFTSGLKSLQSILYSPVRVTFPTFSFTSSPR